MLSTSAFLEAIYSRIFAGHDSSFRRVGPRHPQRTFALGITLYNVVSAHPFRVPRVRQQAGKQATSKTRPEKLSRGLIK